MPAQSFLVADLWLGSKRGPTPITLTDGALTAIDADADAGVGVGAGALRRIPLSLMPGVIDHHVHLGLVERGLLADGPIVEVHDLGWALDEVKRWRADPPHGLKIKLAGPFHTAIGGYPSGRPWAPDAAVRGVRDQVDARVAVAEAAGAGVDAIKIALQSEMPLLSDTLLRTLVEAAHDAGLPAIVHAEGPLQAQRAIDSGADTLVHAPWTERLSDETLSAGKHMTWVSTLAIHDGEQRAIAIDNLSRFHAAGGTVRYGTDMGNGQTPLGPNATEIEALEQAGITGDELIGALTGIGELPTETSTQADRWLASPRPLPSSAAELISWLSECRRFGAADLNELR
jgi:imidazolonepropionase-like amidohydrolase